MGCASRRRFESRNMTDVIQSALTMLRAGEWMPVTAARVLVGIFFCISGGTKLFVKAQFAVLEQTMVQYPVPARKCALRRRRRIRMRGGPGARAAHAAQRCNAHGRHDRRDRRQSDPQHPDKRCPCLARRVPVPSRGAIHVDPNLADLLWAGSIQRRWPHRVESRPLRCRALVSRSNTTE
jgi:hypothetical protein